MVAIVRPSTSSHSATNVVRRNPVVDVVGEARTDARKPVSYRAWLCAESFSARGFVLDLSEDGARLGGVGFKFALGESVVLKIVLDESEPPIVLKAEIARTDPVCVRFVGWSHDDTYRLGRLLDRIH